MRLGLGLGLRKTPQGRVDQILSSWESRVSANGGTVSQTTKTAVRDFLRTTNNLGILGRLLRLNLFCGDNLAACLTPQIIGDGFTVEQNINFVAGNYTEAGGLAGTGLTHLRTGFTFTKANAIGGVFYRLMVGGGNNRWIYGAADTGTAVGCERPVGSSQQRFRCGDSTIQLDNTSSVGYYGMRRASATDFKVFKGGSEVAASVTLNAIEFPAFPVAFFNLNNGGAYQSAIVCTIGGYAFDDGTIPDADQLAWRNAWVALGTAIGRP